MKTKRKGKGTPPVKSKSRRTDVTSILKEHPSLSLVSTEYGEKVKCSLTGHEMKCSLEAVKNYIDSKSYKRATEGWYKDEAFKEYEPFIVQNKKNEKKLFCTLTRISLNKIPEEVKNHVSGKKYKRLLKEATAKQSEKKEKSDQASVKYKSTGKSKAKSAFSIQALEDDLGNEIHSE
mmetsp:Transcript_16825/g.22038  ORF Transcript_16825/g.22038 Transcript_16825/m.22038 type:complete len:177 (+) Transcript_16825:44-574(+)